MFFGCSSQTSVIDIKKTSTDGVYEIYTVYFSNGTTSQISVKPGEDGKDGQDLNLEQLYNYCVQGGLYENSSSGYEQFLQDYISNRVGKNSNIYNSLNSAVAVYSAFKSKNNLYNLSAGSGVIWWMGETDSYIVTNCHVIANSISSDENKLPAEIMVYQYGATISAGYIQGSGHEEYEFAGGINATCVGYSIDFDIAVLKVSTQELLNFNSNACAASVADDYSVAEDVFAIGNPEAEGFSVTHGIVSVVSENIDINNFPADNLPHSYRVMRIDVPIYSGNSGGGLFNSRGELVGIINASLDGADNYNYALPIDNVKQVVSSLIYYHEAGNNAYNLQYITMADLGIKTIDVYDNYNTVNGKLTYKVKVSSFTKTTLKNLGLKLNDEIVELKIDAQTYKITRGFQLDDILISVRKNSIVTFTISRIGENFEVENFKIELPASVIEDLHFF